MLRKENATVTVHAAVKLTATQFCSTSAEVSQCSTTIQEEDEVRREKETPLTLKGL